MFGRKQLHDYFEANKKNKSERIFQVLGDDGKESEQASFLDLDQRSYALSKYLLSKYPVKGERFDELNFLNTYIRKQNHFAHVFAFRPTSIRDLITRLYLRVNSSINISSLNEIQEDTSPFP